MTLQIALLGAGRIGLTHARAVCATEGVRLSAVFDPHRPSAERVASLSGARIETQDAIFADPSIQAVLICTPTALHAEQVERSARAGKAILCEKPIHLDVARVQTCLKVVEECAVQMTVGFNRRFDPHFLALKQQIDAGVVGEIELIQITSRDPAPPPSDYIRESGGLFRDMMIHDFDMARFITGEEFTHVSASGSVLVDAAIGQAGDVDTAIATLRTQSGRLCVITNSRRATYGYDQRIEVHGSNGLVTAENPRATTVSIADANGYRVEPLCDFFMARYEVAYRREIEAFCAALSNGGKVSPSGEDGLRALLLAEAAERSMRTGQSVAVGVIDGR